MQVSSASHHFSNSKQHLKIINGSERELAEFSGYVGCIRKSDFLICDQVGCVEG